MMNPVMDEVMGPEKGTTPETVGEMKEEGVPVAKKPEDVVEPKDTVSPVITEVSYYYDEQLSESVTDIIRPGETVYTKVVFSEPVRQVVADDNTSRPALFVVIDNKAVRYRTKEREKDLESGDCKPMKGADVYLCRYTIPEDTSGIVALRVGGATADEAGNRVMESVTHPSSIMAEKPKPAIVLPNGYKLPAYLTPQTETVLSDNEMMLMETDKWAKIVHPNFDPFKPTPQTKVGYPADLISLLPYKDREEVYDLFVASVNLPYFAEAAEIMKEVNLALIKAMAESRMLDDDRAHYREVRRRVFDKIGVTEDDMTRIGSIYFEENPQEARYIATCSRNWFIIEFVRLSFQHPNADKQELYDKYRVSVQKDTSSDWIDRGVKYYCFSNRPCVTQGRFSHTHAES